MIICISEKFQKYDFGRIGNKKHYGQPTPPEYDLTNTKVPIGFFWAESDYLATPEVFIIVVFSIL